MIDGHRYLRMLLLPLAATFLLAAAPKISWKDHERGTKIMHQKKRAAVVFFAGEDEFTKLAEETLFTKKTFLSKLKKVVPIRIESAKESSKKLCEKYEVVPGTGAIVILDVQEERMGRFRQDLEAEEIEEVEEKLKEAIDISEEKGKILKKLEKAFEAAEKGYKSKKYPIALKGYHLVLQIQEQKGDVLDSPLYTKAEEAIEEIRAIAQTQIDEAQKFLDAKNYAKARNLARAVEHNFPDEQIQNAVKALKEAIEQKQLDEYKGR